MSGEIFVVGVGMTKFEKPGRRENFDYPDMAKEAVERALVDCGLRYNQMEQAYVGYVYGDSTCGQRALYPLGMTGIPIFNVNNNCATGSSALMLAKQAIEGGIADCVLAVGFEKMERGSLGAKFPDRTSPMDKHIEVMMEKRGFSGGPPTAQMFGNAGREHMERYGTKADHFAKIAHKNHSHSTNNPNSQFQEEYSMEQIRSSNCIHDPLTKLQCCPTSDGGAAAVLCSRRFLRDHPHLQANAVQILSLEMATDLPSTFEGSDMNLVGYEMSRLAAQKALRKANLTINDIQVIELHDCFSANELITYEALGLCGEGEAGAFVDRGDNTYGGKFVVNPSGGLISKGHPLGATGIAQCAELCWHLRGVAGKRQVPSARVGLQHNVGLGGACVVGIYRLAGQTSESSSSKAKSKEDFKSTAVFDQVAEVLKKNGTALTKKLNAVFCFRVHSGEKQGTWVVDMKRARGSVKFCPGADEAASARADCTISMSDDDLAELMSGALNPQLAFMQGKLKIVGNMAVALKLRIIQAELAAARSSL